MPSMAFAEGPVDADSGVVFTKTASQTNDGNVEITLKAYTTSTTVTSISSRPVDIVLVLDELEKHYAQYKPELVAAVHSVKESFK